jgi:hypothetical protein
MHNNELRVCLSDGAKRTKRTTFPVGAAFFGTGFFVTAADFLVALAIFFAEVTFFGVLLLAALEAGALALRFPGVPRGFPVTAAFDFFDTMSISFINEDR